MNHAPDPHPDAPVIALRGVSRSFGDLTVLNNVSLDFETGRTTVVIGPSGTGKSVLLKIIVGLLKPDAGQVLFDGNRIDNATEAQLAEVRTQFGFLFQMSALFDSMTVAQNVCFSLSEHTRMSRDQQAQRCREVLHLVGLDGTESQMPAVLSGGQRKRIALARAIALEPRVIFYDEPTTGLDPARADLINELIVRLQQRLRVTSIVVTHDMTSAYKIADRIVMLYDGKLIADGSPNQIQQTRDPIVQRFIEGRADEAEMARIAAID